MYTCQQSFYANIFDVFPDLFASLSSILFAVFVYMIKNSCKASFVSHILMAFINILNEAIGLLVYCIVC